MAPKKSAKGGAAKKRNAEKESQPSAPQREEAPVRFCEGYNGQKCEFSVSDPGEPSRNNKGYKTCLICDPPRMKKMIEDDKMRNISPSFNVLRNGKMEVLSKAVNRLSGEEVMTIMFGGRYCVGALYGLQKPCRFNEEHARAPAKVHDKSCGPCGGHRCMWCCTPYAVMGIIKDKKQSYAEYRKRLPEILRAEEEKRKDYTLEQQKKDLTEHCKVIGELVTKWHREAHIDDEVCITCGGWIKDPDDACEGKESGSDHQECKQLARSKDGKFTKAGASSASSSK